MLKSFFKRIAAVPGSIKQVVTNTKESLAASNAAKAFEKQKEILEKIIAIFVKVVLYALIPLYLAFVFVIVLISAICRGIYKGLFYAVKGLRVIILVIGKGIAALWAGIIRVTLCIGRSLGHFAVTAVKLVKEVPKKMKFFKGLILVFEKVILFLLVPPLFIILLIIILFSKIFPFVYKWIAYGLTALRVILTFIGETRGLDEDETVKKIEFTGFTYDSDKDIFYSIMNPWQRKFGYCRLYDEAAALWGMIVDCEPIYFEYDGKKWLIEFWKGQYDLTTGCEIGVYTTEGPSLDIPGVFNGTFYNSGSSADQLKMSFCLKKDNQTLFKRDGEHWWLTGFVLGEFSKPSELSMKITITLKDSAMCNSFVKGLKKAGYSDCEIIKNGNDVSLSFDKPKTPQPFTRMRLTDWLIQKRNKRLCKKYKKIIGTSNNIQDKLMAIKQKAPKLYSKIVSIGKSQKLYNKYRKINDYLK